MEVESHQSWYAGAIVRRNVLRLKRSNARGRKAKAAAAASSSSAAASSSSAAAVSSAPIVKFEVGKFYFMTGHENYQWWVVYNREENTIFFRSSGGGPRINWGGEAEIGHDWYQDSPGTRCEYVVFDDQYDRIEIWSSSGVSALPAASSSSSSSSSSAAPAAAPASVDVEVVQQKSGQEALDEKFAQPPDFDFSNDSEDEDTTTDADGSDAIDYFDKLDKLSRREKILNRTGRYVSSDDISTDGDDSDDEEAEPKRKKARLKLMLQRLSVTNPRFANLRF